MGARLANVLELLPGLAHPLTASAVDPLLHLAQARLDVLAIAEGAALPAQQQLVEELYVDKAKELLEQLAHQEGRHVAALQRPQQLVEHLQDVGPVLAQLRGACACRATASAESIFCKNIRRRTETRCLLLLPNGRCGRAGACCVGHQNALRAFNARSTSVEAACWAGWRALAWSGGGVRAVDGLRAARASAGSARGMDAGSQLRRYLLLHVVAQHGEDFLHKSVQLLFEEQRRVLGFHLQGATAGQALFSFQASLASPVRRIATTSSGGSPAGTLPRPPSGWRLPGPPPRRWGSRRSC